MLIVIMPSVIMLSVIMLSVIMLSVIMLSVIMLSVVMLSVVRNVDWSTSIYTVHCVDQMSVGQMAFV